MAALASASGIKASSPPVDADVALELLAPAPVASCSRRLPILRPLCPCRRDARPLAKSFYRPREQCPSQPQRRAQPWKVFRRGSCDPPSATAWLGLAHAVPRSALSFPMQTVHRVNYGEVKGVISIRPGEAHCGGRPREGAYRVVAVEEGSPQRRAARSVTGFHRSKITSSSHHLGPK